MRPSLLETGLETVAYNINHRNQNLLLFEFGKIYSTSGTGKYNEVEKCCFYVSGNKNSAGWKEKESRSDIFYLKGVCENIFRLSGIKNAGFKINGDAIDIIINKEAIGQIIHVQKGKLEKFSLKQPVFFGEVLWDKITEAAKNVKIEFNELLKYPEVHRDISMVLAKDIPYEKVEGLTRDLRIPKLSGIKLFDIFESEKLGADKRSLAVTFTFSDREKTLTDKEIDAMMNKIIVSYEKDLGAAIRTS
jgi:phenylalanyl-tRNA synthetase beta chain